MLPGDTDDFRALCEALIANGHVSRVQPKQFADFPYDAGLLFPSRLAVALREAEIEQDHESRSRLLSLQKALRPSWKARGAPNPYAALIVADGDRMGEFVDRASSAEMHRRITEAVAAFSDQVPVIARQHTGQSIYNGGEDMMLLLPLDRIVDGARALSRCFAESMREIGAAVRGDSGSVQPPSLRVGAAICHVLEPLGLIRARADAAEKAAKGSGPASRQGDALALALTLRTGHLVQARFPFGSTFAATDPAAPGGFEHFARWCAAYGRDVRASAAASACARDDGFGSLPGRMGYDLRALVERNRRLRLADTVVDAEFRGLCARAQSSGGTRKLAPAMIEALQARSESLKKSVGGSDPAARALLLLADELILARWLSAATDLSREEAA